MSRFQKLSHVIWHCQYHNVWVPKYRHRILTGEVGREVSFSPHEINRVIQEFETPRYHVDIKQ